MSLPSGRLDLRTLLVLLFPKVLSERGRHPRAYARGRVAGDNELRSAQKGKLVKSEDQVTLASDPTSVKCDKSAG